MPTWMSYTPLQGYYIKKWKAKQALYDASKCNTPCRDNNDKYYGLKKVFHPHVDISATYLWSQDGAESQATKNGLLWVYSHMMVLMNHLEIYLYILRYKFIQFTHC